MDDEDDTGANSVHGKLVQHGDDSSNRVSDVNDGKKTAGHNDCKVDITIPKPTSLAERRRQTRLCAVAFVITVLILLSIGVAIIVIIYRSHSRPPIVYSKVGTTIGRYVASPQGDLVEEYLGIPFAKPPLGELRYADPVPLEFLPNDPYEAIDVKYSCIQVIDTQFGNFTGLDMWNPKNPLREDCLYLNVWAPVRTSGDSTKKAVMVWIYGGGFFAGSNSLWVYDGKALAAYGDVIVVSLNYRVGTFGYLSTGDGRIRGNFGMKDQVVALTWIRDNIEAFGGDPTSVTIFGESSGASSAGLHQMSKHSQHLFTRAIYQSGSADSHWSFMTRRQARTRSKEFFSRVNCSYYDSASSHYESDEPESTKKLLSCLRRLSSDVILNNEWVDSNFMVFPWAPSIDGDFLENTPYNLLSAGRFQRKEALLGVNRDEGTFWILFALPGFSRYGPSLHNYSSYLEGVDMIGWDLTVNQRERLKALYTVHSGTDMDANRDALDKVCGDRSFTCPTEELAETYNRHGVRTYFYYLTHRSSVEVWPPWMGVIHGADIQWVFGMPLNKNRGYLDKEVEFSKTIMTYWTNFAKTGNPNGPSLPEWPEYDAQNRAKYLELRGPPDNFTVLDTFRSKYCAVWREINKENYDDS